MVITERDIQLLLWINGFGFVTVVQVARWMGVDFSTAARRVRLLREAGLIRQIKSQIFNSKPIILTPLGVAVAADGLPPLKGIRAGEYRHDNLLVDVACGLTAKFPGSKFEPVRRIRHAEAANHLPDGYLYHNGERFIVELELTVKSPRRLVAIMGEHTADIGAKEVWYVTGSDAVSRAIARASAGLDFVRIVRLSPKVTAKSEGRA